VRSRRTHIHSAFRTPHSALASRGDDAGFGAPARPRPTARFHSQRHGRPCARGRDGRAPAGGARDGARPHRPERHPLRGGLGRAWREHARRRARDAAGRHRGRRAGHARSARRHAARLPGVAHHRLAPGHHGVRGRRPRERAGRQRSQLRPAAARRRGAGGGVVRAVRVARAQLTRRRGESGDPPCSGATHSAPR